MIENSQLVDKARTFAMAAHYAVGQTRKMTGVPYILHPLDVEKVLIRFNYGVNYPIRAAALLHDVVEDTKIPSYIIHSEFGPLVGHYVDGLTKRSKLEDGDRKTRKKIDLDWMMLQCFEVKTIKLADILCNALDFARDSKSKFEIKFAIQWMDEKRELLEKALFQGDEKLFSFVEESINILCNELRNILETQYPSNIKK